MPSLHQAAADRHRAAAWSSEITLRLATAADLPALERLAQLDSRRLGDGPYLVAVRNGVIEAGLSIGDGELVADPFQRTAELCALLHCHAGSARPASPRATASDPCLQTALAPA